MCPSCSKYFSNPVCLPVCSHNLCMACALRLQAPWSSNDDSTGRLDMSDLDDKLSLYSEADSGVSMSTAGSRPNSYLASSRADLVSHDRYSLCIICPTANCKQVNGLPDEGAASLPKNRVLETIVDKFQTDKNFTAPCQMCAAEHKNSAVLMCEQCEVFYCEQCKDEFHPLRGPLAQHQLVTPLEGKTILRQRNREKESKCKEHAEEHLTMYCLICKETVCYLCIQEGNRHLNHDVQATAAICKSHKVFYLY